MTCLEVDAITIERGGKTVVDAVSLSLAEGEILALLGANGAGKSSLVLGLAGALPTLGSVRLGGQEVLGKAPAEIRAKGLAVVPEGHRILRALSVSDNLDVAGAHLSRPAMAQGRARALSVFPELTDRLDQAAGSMSGGQQQMLAIAQAIVGQPRIIAIDEMSLGLAPLVVKRLMGVVGELRTAGVGILLIEQFAHLALAVADRAMVLERGRVTYDGDAETLALDPEQLHSAYLGS